MHPLAPDSFGNRLLASTIGRGLRFWKLVAIFWKLVAIRLEFFSIRGELGSPVRAYVTYRATTTPKSPTYVFFAFDGIAISPLRYFALLR